MNRRRVITAVVSLALAVSGCASTVDGTAVLAARNADPSSRTTQQDSTLRQDFDQSTQSINDYWNDEARRKAQGKFEDPGAPDPNDPVPDTKVEDVTSTVVPPTSGPTGTVDPQAVGNDSSAARYNLPGLSKSTTGKLFFVMGGKNYVCSATVVSSANASTVATAAHCLYNVEDHTFNSAFQFVPGYDGGDSGAGRWTFDAVWVARAYQGASSYNNQARLADFGFAKVRPQGGRTIASALGAQGIAFGENPSSILVVGWPAEPPFDGQVPRFCADQQWNRRTTVNYTVACQLNGGASGGPWFTRFDPAKGAGYVIGVSSNAVRGSGFLQGTIMGKSALDAYQAAAA